MTADAYDLTIGLTFDERGDLLTALDRTREIFGAHASHDLDRGDLDGASYWMERVDQLKALKNRLEHATDDQPTDAQLYGLDADAIEAERYLRCEITSLGGVGRCDLFAGHDGVCNFVTEPPL